MMTETNSEDARTAHPPVTYYCSKCGAAEIGTDTVRPDGWDIDFVICTDCLRSSNPLRQAAEVKARDAWIQTATGVLVNLTSPEPQMINITDIAIALSRIPRFNGHTTPARAAYTVAEHSVWVSHRVPKELALAALLEDASDAYLGHITRPLKSILPEYGRIRRKMNSAIARAFGLGNILLPRIKEADIEMLHIEAARLMPRNPHCWGDAQQDNISQPICCWSDEEATRRFLERYFELTLHADMPRIAIIGAAAFVTSGSELAEKRAA